MDQMVAVQLCLAEKNKEVSVCYTPENFCKWIRLQEIITGGTSKNINRLQNKLRNQTIIIWNFTGNNSMNKIFTMVSYKFIIKKINNKK
jgi:hypothetical protein